jgi:hypothetical protein
MATLLSDRQETQKVISKLVAQAWLDEEFKNRLIAEPAAVLEENGLSVPSGTQVRVNQGASMETLSNVGAMSGDSEVYEIPLPSKPAELTEQQIQTWVNESSVEGPALCL